WPGCYPHTRPDWRSTAAKRRGRPGIPIHRSPKPIEGRKRCGSGRLVPKDSFPTLGCPRDVTSTHRHRTSSGPVLPASRQVYPLAISLSTFCPRVPAQPAHVARDDHFLAASEGQESSPTIVPAVPPEVNDH